MHNIAIYPGTFDPITNGHLDIIERATKLFDQVIIAIAESTNKKPVFTLNERMSLAESVCGKYPSVKVVGFNSLLTVFAQEMGANIIIRGLRAVSDFEYEFQLAGMNRQIAPTLESIFLMPSERYTYLSASLVREIASLGGDIKRYVPEAVVKALYNKYQGA